METHRDADSPDVLRAREEFLSKLEKRAKKMRRDRASEITAGKDGEEPLLKWKHGDMQVTQLPEDEQKILRISIGGGVDIVCVDYCVFRGDRTRCAYMLEQAAEALRLGPIVG